MVLCSSSWSCWFMNKENWVSFLISKEQVGVEVDLWILWGRGVVVITAAKLHSTKPELRFFCARSNPARVVSEIRDGMDLRQSSRLEIRLNAFRRSTIPQKQFIIIIIRDKLKEDSEFKCQTCLNQQTDTAEGCPRIELNGPSLEIVGRVLNL